MCLEKGSNQRVSIYASVHSQPADLNPIRGTHCKKLFFALFIMFLYPVCKGGYKIDGEDT